MKSQPRKTLRCGVREGCKTVMSHDKNANLDRVRMHHPEEFEKIRKLMDEAQTPTRRIGQSKAVESLLLLAEDGYTPGNLASAAGGAEGVAFKAARKLQENTGG